MNPLPDPAPFYLRGGPTGVLLIHGFTGAPCEMSQIAAYLHERGLTVSGPLLPGHGTTPDDLNSQTWRHWADHVAASYRDLLGQCDAVFVAGLSLGSLLALHLASAHPAMDGVIAYSPPIKVTDWRAPLAAIMKRFVQFMPKPEDKFFDPEAEAKLWCYDVYPVAAAHETLKFLKVVARALPLITCPALIVASAGDDIIHPESAALTYDQLGSSDKEHLTLEKSGHVITLDAEWEMVAEATLRFIQTRQV